MKSLHLQARLESPSSRAPAEGPLCSGHKEPTTIRVINGRNVYVCSRYPMHHCRFCLPADVLLIAPTDGLDQAQQPSGTAPPNVAATAAEPSAEQRDGSPDLAEAEANTNNNQVDEDPNTRGTTPGGNAAIVGSPCPPAPSKQQSHGSINSTARRSSGAASAVRSLTPIFNDFAPALDRIKQLGGRFVTLKSQGNTMARMQRRLSTGTLANPSTPAAAATTEAAADPDKTTTRTTITTIISPTTTTTMKPSTSVLTKKRPAVDGGPPSIGTLPQAKEPRTTAWGRLSTGNSNGNSSTRKFPRI